MKSHSVALYCKNIQKSILARSEEFQVLNAISRLPGKLSTKPKFFDLTEIFRNGLISLPGFILARLRLLLAKQNYLRFSIYKNICEEPLIRLFGEILALRAR
jgi:hypothetical protein